METLVIKVDNKLNATKIREAVSLFRGVKNVSITNFEEIENIAILKASNAARKTRKISEEEVLNLLK